VGSSAVPAQAYSLGDLLS